MRKIALWISSFLFILGTFVVSIFVFKNELLVLDFRPGQKVTKRQVHDNVIEEIELDSMYTRNPDTGLDLSPNSHVRHSMSSSGKTIFDLVYVTNDKGYRPTQSSASDRFLAFFGCSYVFGIGSADSETLPQKAAEKMTSYEVYNFGVPGSGTNYLLARIESNGLSEVLGKRNGIFIYVYIDNHLDRTIGTIDWMYKPFMPNYEWDGQQIQRRGNFESARPLRSFILNQLRTSWVSKYINFENFKHVENKDRDLVCGLMESAKSQLLNQYPQSRFIVLFHPHGSDRDRPYLQKCLDSRKVENVYWAYPPETGASPYQIPVDGHPNAKANEFLAEKIMGYL